jgi:phenylpyruvate tautomerase PptA (4-oxalocrotonate tautomerase family)
MPVYTVVTSTNALSDQTKATLAAEITKTHAAITGAPTSLIHVVFYDQPHANVFTDATPSQPILITGLTRAGRADSEKTRLAKELSANCSRVTGIPEARILVGIQDNPARFAVEGGRVLPEPGTEDDWLDVRPQQADPASGSPSAASIAASKSAGG